MNSAVFWNVTSCGSCKNLRFRRAYRLHHHCEKNIFTSCFGLLIIANVPSSPILVILMMEAIRFSETSVLTRATRRNIPEGVIFQFLNGPDHGI
jgi:hypothetical protein